MSETIKKKVLYFTETRAAKPFKIAKALPRKTEVTMFEIDETLGQPLPDGMELDRIDGEIEGTPKKGASEHSPYQVVVLVNEGEYRVSLEIHVGPALGPEDIAREQAKIWKAIEEGSDIPEDIRKIVDRPITKLDIYYLLERYASFIIWNADDLRLAVDGEPVKVPETSKHFDVYDFDVCIVATPKDLITYDRTLSDALQTARAMAREAHRRKWNVEFGGFDRMATEAWYEIQSLNEQYSHKMTIKNYTPPGVESAASEEQAEPE